MATTPTTRDGQLELSEGSLSELRTRLRGQALTPADAGYADARAPFNAMHADRPGLVVRCSGTADVVEAVNFAREHGIELTVRGGAHSVAGLSSSDGGMVVDLSLMRGVEVDAEARLARVQGGAVLGDVDRETQLHGLATPLGAASETGVAGLTLGGGYGWLRGKHGLACDNLVSAQVVGADGGVRTASEDVNPDLFWALRGGGGNFGIVTSFTFRLHEIGPIVAFAGVFYALEDGVEVYRRLREFTEDLPDEISVEALAVASELPADPHLPEAVHNRRVVLIGAVYAGDSDEGMRALQPLRELGTPLADISQPMPFTVVQSAFDGFFPRGQVQAYWKSLYLRELPDEAIETLVRLVQERPSGSSAFEFVFADIYPMRGAMTRVGPEDTAFGERGHPWMLLVDANWTDDADSEATIAWTRQVIGDLEPWGTGTQYLNFTALVDEPGAAAVDAALGRNLRRLAEVKAKYDPDNFFRRNNNIAPAA